MAKTTTQTKPSRRTAADVEKLYTWAVEKDKTEKLEALTAAVDFTLEEFLHARYYAWLERCPANERHLRAEVEKKLDNTPQGDFLAFALENNYAGIKKLLQSKHKLSPRFLQYTSDQAGYAGHDGMCDFLLRRKDDAMNTPLEKMKTLANAGKVRKMKKMKPQKNFTADELEEVANVAKGRHKKAGLYLRQLVAGMRGETLEEGERVIAAEKYLDTEKKKTAFTRMPRVIGIHPETGAEIRVNVRKISPRMPRQAWLLHEEAKIRIPQKGTYNPYTMDLKEALEVLTLPHAIGTHNKSGENIVLDIDHSGLIVSHHGQTRPLNKDLKISSVDKDIALKALATARRGRGNAAILADLGDHPEDGKPVSIRKGKHSIYAHHFKTRAVWPQDIPPEIATLEQAITCLQDPEKQYKNHCPPRIDPDTQTPVSRQFSTAVTGQKKDAKDKKNNPKIHLFIKQAAKNF